MVLIFLLIFQSATRRGLRTHRKHRNPQSNTDIGGGISISTKASQNPLKMAI
jgi:hypothetical protein